MIILINFGNQCLKIQQGERIAQLIIQKCETVEWEEVESLTTTERNLGGFGSTGK